MAELPEKVRTFVAIYPTDEIVAQLQTVQTHLRKNLAADSVRWTAPDQIHLTLQFLGYIKSDFLESFETVLEQSVNESDRFKLCAEKIGCFPSNKRPRIIWAGISGEVDPLQTLKQKLDAALSGLGYVPEERKFHPHLTIGRVASLKTSDAGRLATGISQYALTQFGNWVVTEVKLMQSILSPKGAKYRVLKAFPLKPL